GLLLGDLSGRTGEELEALLQGDLGNHIRSNLMGAQPERVYAVSVPAQWDEVLKGAQAGDFPATTFLRDRIMQDPTLLHDPELNLVVSNAARDRLARDLERERLTGDPANPALMNANRLLAQGGLPALFKELSNPKAFLPMLFLGLGIPGLDQAGP